MKEVLNRLFEHQHLDKVQAREILVNSAGGKYNSAQVAAFITVFLMRSVSVEELQGFREALLELCVNVDFSDFNIIDLCGTGGDGKNTFNISTLFSFVVAGADGIIVEIHEEPEKAISDGQQSLTIEEATNLYRNARTVLDTKRHLY